MRTSNAMDGVEFNDIQMALGLEDVDMLFLLKICTTTLHNWQKNKLPVNPCAALALRMLKEHPTEVSKWLQLQCL
jgi:hypothetical protein